MSCLACGFGNPPKKHVMVRGVNLKTSEIVDLRLPAPVYERIVQAMQKKPSLLQRVLTWLGKFLGVGEQVQVTKQVTIKAPSGEYQFYVKP